jgi:hypothetical protein
VSLVAIGAIGVAAFSHQDQLGKAPTHPVVVVRTETPVKGPIHAELVWYVKTVSHACSMTPTLTIA